MNFSHSHSLPQDIVNLHAAGLWGEQMKTYMANWLPPSYGVGAVGRVRAEWQITFFAHIRSWLLLLTAKSSPITGATWERPLPE